MCDLGGVVDSGHRQSGSISRFVSEICLESCLRGTLEKAVAQTRGSRLDQGAYPTPVRFCNSVGKQHTDLNQPFLVMRTMYLGC